MADNQIIIDVEATGVREANAGINSLDKSISNLTQDVQGNASAWNMFKSAAAGAIGAISIKAAANDVLDSTNTVQGLERQLKYTEGSAYAAGLEFEKLIKLAGSVPALDVEGAVSVDTSFRRMGYSADKAKGYTAALGNAIASIGGGSAQVERVKIQMEQLFFKTSGFAQDVRAMSESLPMVGKLIRDAFNVSSIEDLSDMGVIGSQVIEALMNKLAEMPKSNTTVQDSTESMQSSWQLLGYEVGQVIAPAISVLADGIKNLSNWLRDLPDGFKAFVVWGSVIGAGVLTVNSFINTIGLVKDTLKGLTIDTAASATAMGTNASAVLDLTTDMTLAAASADTLSASLTNLSAVNAAGGAQEAVTPSLPSGGGQMALPGRTFSGVGVDTENLRASAAQAAESAGSAFAEEFPAYASQGFTNLADVANKSMFEVSEGASDIIRNMDFGDDTALRDKFNNIAKDINNAFADIQLNPNVNFDEVIGNLAPAFGQIKNEAGQLTGELDVLGGAFVDVTDANSAYAKAQEVLSGLNSINASTTNANTVAIRTNSTSKLANYIATVKDNIAKNADTAANVFNGNSWKLNSAAVKENGFWLSAHQILTKSGAKWKALFTAATTKDTAATIASTLADWGKVAALTVMNALMDPAKLAVSLGVIAVAGASIAAYRGYQNDKNKREMADMQKASMPATGATDGSSSAADTVGNSAVLPNAEATQTSINNSGQIQSAYNSAGDAIQAKAQETSTQMIKVNKETLDAETAGWKGVTEYSIFTSQQWKEAHTTYYNEDFKNAVNHIEALKKLYKDDADFKKAMQDENLNKAISVNEQIMAMAKEESGGSSFLHGIFTGKGWKNFGYNLTHSGTYENELIKTKTNAAATVLAQEAETKAREAAAAAIKQQQEALAKLNSERVTNIESDSIIAANSAIMSGNDALAESIKIEADYQKVMQDSNKTAKDKEVATSNYTAALYKANKAAQEKANSENVKNIKETTDLDYNLNASQGLKWEALLIKSEGEYQAVLEDTTTSLKAKQSAWIKYADEVSKVQIGIMKEDANLQSAFADYTGNSSGAKEINATSAYEEVNIDPTKTLKEKWTAYYKYLKTMADEQSSAYKKTLDEYKTKLDEMLTKRKEFNGKILDEIKKEKDAEFNAAGENYQVGNNTFFNAEETNTISAADINQEDVQRIGTNINLKEQIDKDNRNKVDSLVGGNTEKGMSDQVKLIDNMNKFIDKFDLSGQAQLNVLQQIANSISNLNMLAAADASGSRR